MHTLNIHRILIPTDFSETSLLAIDHGAYLAGLFNAEIILLHVIEENWQSINVIEPSLAIVDMEKVRDFASRKLDEIAKTISGKHAVRIQKMVSEGTIAHEIVRVAKENTADLIMMGTHGVSGFKEFFAGSNTYRVVTLSQCPVFSVQAQAKLPGCKHIVMPIDHTDHSRQKVPFTLRLAKKYGASVHALGILHPYEKEDVNKMSLKLKQVEEFAKKEGVSCTSEIIEGKNPARLTLDHAARLNADLIAIMTDQENGLFLGAYAQQVVNHSRIPVLSITPEEHPERIHGWSFEID